MKRLLSIIFAVIICFPAFADETDFMVVAGDERTNLNNTASNADHIPPTDVSPTSLSGKEVTASSSPSDQCTEEQLTAINATKGKIKNKKCIPTQCDSANGYKKKGIGDNTKCEKETKCDPKDKNAKKATYDTADKCKINECKKGYVPSNDGTKCEQTIRQCNKIKDKKIWPVGATTAEYKDGTCVATACEADKYELEDGKCVPLDQDTAVDSESTTNIDPEKQAKIDELEKKVEEKKAIENSTANKLLGATGMATMGIGGMQIASALSEKSADAAAEQDMRAYLATFSCDYGNGRNIAGGETNVQLPDSSFLIPYVSEYKQLATELKATKEALGMAPGIESEVVLDSATMGLYDNVGVGRQSGAFTSLSRALLDENSADAAKWQEQKDATAQKLKTGAITAGVGAAVTIAGNLIVNNDNIKEKIKEAKARKDANKTEAAALKNLQKCLSDGGATNTDKLHFDKFTPSILSLENIDCTGADWKTAINERDAQSLFVDTDNHYEIGNKLTDSFSPNLVKKLLGI